MAEAERVSLNIGGQEFVLMIKPEERDDVQEAVDTVKEQIHDLAKRGAVGIQKQAVMTAFNLAFDGVRLSRDPLFDKRVRIDLERRVDTLLGAIDKALQT
jgi:cell division protein ZapA (FtsZ GTPase activity inhibitor)